MRTVNIVRFIWSRTKPHVIVKLSWYPFRNKIFLTYPKEFPSKTVGTGNCHFERPSEHTTVDKFFQRFDRCAEAIEIIGKAEPCIQSKNTVIAFYGFTQTLSFADSAGHGFLTPHILTGISGIYSHLCMPVRRRGHVHHVDICISDQIAVIMICLRGDIQF